MMIAFLISLVAAYLLPATPAATTCGHRLDAATARDRVEWVEINCETLPCPCLPPDPRTDGDDGGSQGGGGGENKPRRRAQRIDAKITEVVDGDTVKVRAYGAKRERYTVRLIGIDTPETKRPGAPVECGRPQASSNM